MKWLRRLLARPDDEAFHALLADYELLIRSARRCAYDLRHVIAHIDWDRDPDMYQMFESRSLWWERLFSRGNPGKDYRHHLTQRLNDRDEIFEKIVAYYAEHECPAELKKLIDAAQPCPF